MFILPFTKSKIEAVEQQIIRDFASALETAYVLPVEFSEPKKVSKNVYRVSTDVVEGKGKFYPRKVFSGGDLSILRTHRGTALALSSDYESLGDLFGNNDGEYLFGIKVDDGGKKEFKDYVTKMWFDINTQTGTYQITEPELVEKQKQ